MNGFRSTQTDLAAITPPKFTLSMCDRDENDVAGTRLRGSLSIDVRTEGALRHASERNDREMFPPADMLDAQLDQYDRVSAAWVGRDSVLESNRPARPINLTSSSDLRYTYADLGLGALLELTSSE